MTGPANIDARRARPAYRVGVWSFRLSLVVVVVYLAAMASQAVPFLSWPSAFPFYFVYFACVITGYALFARVGMPSFGSSPESKTNRRIVWRDVFWRGGR